METELYAGYIQDDYKLSRRINLHLSMHYESDTPWHDQEHTTSLGQPNQPMPQNPPVMLRTITARGVLPTAAPRNLGIAKERLPAAPRHGVEGQWPHGNPRRMGANMCACGVEFHPRPYTGLGNVSFFKARFMGFDAQQNHLPLDQGTRGPLSPTRFLHRVPDCAAR